MPDPSLVTIVVTSYNYARYIGQTIQSVLDQTHQDIELIVCDDNSADGSLDVIRSFNDRRLTLITSTTNDGPYSAYNKGVRASHGAYLGTIDSDDWIAPDKIEKQLDYLNRHPDVDVLGTYATEVDADGKPIGSTGTFEDWFNRDIDYNKPESWICENHLCHSSVLMRRSLHDRIGWHNGTMMTAADYEYWVRAFIGGARFHVLPEQLTYYRAHGGNVTTKKQVRGCVELGYIHSLLRPYLLRTERRDLDEQGLQKLREWCYTGHMGELMAKMILGLSDPIGTPLPSFDQFTRTFADLLRRRAAKAPRKAV